MRYELTYGEAWGFWSTKSAKHGPTDLITYSSGFENFDQRLERAISSQQEVHPNFVVILIAFLTNRWILCSSL